MVPKKTRQLHKLRALKHISCQNIAYGAALFVQIYYTRLEQSSIQSGHGEKTLPSPWS